MRFRIREYLVSLLLLCWTTTVTAASFVVKGNDATDTVYFRSAAKLEFIQGKTNSIDGFVEFDPARPDGLSAGTLRVDLRTLKTGIDMRDEHMRTRYLHTDKYPYAYFKLAELTDIPSAMKPDSLYSVRCRGEFYLCGNRRMIEPALAIMIHRLTADSYRLIIRARFSLDLDEWGIERPKAIFLKLAKTIDIEVIFASVNELSHPAVTLPDWPEI